MRGVVVFFNSSKPTPGGGSSPGSGGAGYVNPEAEVGAAVYPGEFLFPDELVEGAVALEPVEPFQAYLEAGKMEISCLSRKMLGMACAAHQLVKLTAAITAADSNSFSIVLSQGLQNLLAEVLEVGNSVHRRLVANAMRFGYGTSRELGQAEVFCQFLSFHVSAIQVVHFTSSRLGPRHLQCRR